MEPFGGALVLLALFVLFPLAHSGLLWNIIPRATDNKMAASSQRISWREWWVNRQKHQEIMRELDHHYGDQVTLVDAQAGFNDPDERGYYARLQVHGTCEGIDERLARHGANHTTVYNPVLDKTEAYLFVRRVRVRDYTAFGRWLKRVGFAMGMVSVFQIAWQVYALG